MALTAGQQRCVDTLDRPLVVAAGAGSGKTFTLTQRIVGAFERGVVTDIDEVCAITFTKKAAGELKSRIKAELRARNFTDQALRVDEAWVSTIHGMCARILRAHAIQLGLDPSFKVAEGAEIDDYLAQAVDSVLVEAQEEGSPRIDALFAEYPARSFGGFGTSVEGMLTTLVGAASACAEGAGAFVLPGLSLAPDQAAMQAIDVVEGLAAIAQAEKASAARDNWLAATTAALEEAHAALDGGALDYEEALRVVAPFKLVKTFGSKEFKAQVEEVKGVLGACTMEIRLGAAHVHLETLAGLAQRTLDVFSALKRADGVLDNNDLLVLAAQAIEEHPDIAAQYADKFKLVMVDEFQDTDQMQVDMIKRLAGEGACRLCTVGDAQQSIYRFRGADVSVYRQHLATVRDSWPDSIIKLADNFRSHPDVLSFVDCVFGKPAMFGGEFMSLAAGRDEGKVEAPFSEGVPRIVVQHTSRPWRGIDSAQAVEVAAQRIADTFAQLVKAGHAPGEMVVLLGRMVNADVYAWALRSRGLPCVVSGGSVFARTPEAQLMRLLARVLGNPTETQSLFNVLTSPLFALTAGDLLGVDGVAGFWRAAFDNDALEYASPQLACALRVMAQARAAIGRMPVSRIMQRVIVDSGWLSRRQSEGAEGLAAAANAFKAIRMVGSIEQSGAWGPSSVSRRFDEALACSKEAPGALSVSGGDSVRIMTIHASKGLEFPIVAVAEIKENRAPSARLLEASVGGKVYLSLDLGRTLDVLGDTVDSATQAAMREYVLGLAAGEDELAQAVAEDAGALHRRLALREYLAAGDEEEAKRLLYVALTRAKEALVVSSIGARTKDNAAGIPKSALSGLFEALCPSGAGFEAGSNLCGFGGSAPAVLECVALEAADGPDEQEEPPDEQESLFMVPAPEDAPVLTHEVYKPAHEGVFSYSSVSDASHEGDLLDRLAASFAVSVDAGMAGGEALEYAADPLMPTASPVSFDDDFWGFDLAASFDEDRATDLGTAFHRLAQFAVIARGGEGPLAMPPSARIEALSRTCNLNGMQRARLDEALQRWFGSDVARIMETLSNLAPEVPFFVKVPLPSGEDAYLEGEIDLLGFDEPRERATVVDYKTGGRDDETEDDLRRKHVLQAACYAYAIMLQGTQEVDALFVRVERPRGDDPAQPQCVRYHFEQSDMHTLAQAIADAYVLGCARKLAS